MSPSRDSDQVNTADNGSLSALDDVLGQLFSTRIGRYLKPTPEQNQRPLPIDEDTGSPHRPTGIAGLVAGLATSIPHMKRKDFVTLLKVGEAAALNEPIDDRKQVMESMIQAAVRDEDGVIGARITQNFVQALWDDLEHPPENQLAGKFRFRTADGKNNALLQPHMGASGQPYARTVKPKDGQPAVLPDPGLLFDTLLARRQPTEHPTKISSMLFYLATIIIHDIFRTSHTDFSYSGTSSYLDLAPLYGSNQEEQDKIRTRLDGKLKPDCFSETRLLMLPPGSAILLIMFNRFHNHIAEGLAAIDERQRFTRPDDTKSEAYKKYDEEVFQTARLITCGLYVNIILMDYVGTILNLNRTDSDWRLDPRLEVPGGPAMGGGNQVAAEFNLVYRWHATVSTRDEKWTQDAFERLFPGKKIEDLDQATFLGKLKETGHTLYSLMPEDRPLEGFKRQKNGFYKDEDLVASLIGSIDDVANAFGPRQVPTALKAVEILGIKQARAWNLASLNEFRKHFSLRPYERFEDITSDSETQQHLQHLYKHPDNVELYPGLAVEDAKEPLVPGAGLCPSYTISRAILADATALVRGDRFFTTSYHPRILTNWGWEEAWYDPQVDKGCVLYKLFQRSFSNHFHPDSIYSHYPFTISNEVRTIFQDALVHRAPLYNMDVAVAKLLGRQHIVSTRAAALAVLEDTDSFSIDLSLAVKLLAPNQRNNKSLIEYLGKHILEGPSSHLTAPNHNLIISVCDALERDLDEHIHQKAYKLPKFSQADIVGSVINRCALRLAANIFSIPTKTRPEDTSAPVTELELAAIFSALAGSWSGFDTVTNVGQRQKVTGSVSALRKYLLPSIKTQTQHLIHTTRHERSDSEFTRYRTDILCPIARSLSEANPDDIADAAFSAILILAASLSSTIATHFSESLNAALHAHPSHLRRLHASRTDATSESDWCFDAYAHELGRLSSTIVALRTVTRAVTVGNVALRPGDRVLLSSARINKDISDPATVRLDRAPDAYLPVNMTFGVRDKLWQDIHQGCLRSLLKVVGGLRGIRAATVWDGDSVPASIKRLPVWGGSHDEDPAVDANGANGVSEVNGSNGNGVEKPNGKKEEEEPAQYVFLTEQWDGLSVVPTSLMVDFDHAQ